MQGNDSPDQLGANKWSELSKNVWLMLQMCDPIFGTGKAVVINTLFFMEKGITALEERDVYSGALIKKRKYWPKGVPGDDIDRNFHNRDVGDVDAMEAMTGEFPEGNPFRIFFFSNNLSMS